MSQQIVAGRRRNQQDHQALMRQMEYSTNDARQQSEALRQTISMQANMAGKSISDIIRRETQKGIEAGLKAILPRFLSSNERIARDTGDSRLSARQSFRR